MSKITLAISAVTVALLTACGGGGDDSPSTSTPTTPAVSTTAEGFWSGTTSNGATVSIVILENGEIWAPFARSGVLAGAVNGTATSANGSISGSGIQFSSGAVASGSFSGTYAAKSNLNLTLSDGTKVTANYSSSYEQAPSLAVIAGTYTGYVSTKSASGFDSVTVGTDGSIRSGTSGTCLTTGTATPRASGKNVLNVALSFSGPSCILGNGSTTNGVAYYDAATRQLIALTLNSGKTDGLLFLGAK